MSVQGSSGVHWAEVPTELTSHFPEFQTWFVLCRSALSFIKRLREIEYAYCKFSSIEGFRSLLFL